MNTLNWPPQHQNICSFELQQQTNSNSEQEQQIRRGMESKKSRTLARLLGAIKFVVAPMVRASDLPFRMLCRHYGFLLSNLLFHILLYMHDHCYLLLSTGATLCYTPMYFSDRFWVLHIWFICLFFRFVSDAQYRDLVFRTCGNDRPLGSF